MGTTCTRMASSNSSIITSDRSQKKKAVILLLMRNDRSQGHAMAIAGSTKGVVATSFEGTQLVVVGVGVDWMRLTSRLAKKLGDAQLQSLQVVAHDGDTQPRRTFTAADDYYGDRWWNRLTG